MKLFNKANKSKQGPDLASQLDSELSGTLERAVLESRIEAMAKYQEMLGNVTSRQVLTGSFDETHGTLTISTPGFEIRLATPDLTQAAQVAAQIRLEKTYLTLRLASTHAVAVFTSPQWEYWLRFDSLQATGVYVD